MNAKRLLLIVLIGLLGSVLLLFGALGVFAGAQKTLDETIASLPIPDDYQLIESEESGSVLAWFGEYPTHFRLFTSTNSVEATCAELPDVLADWGGAVSSNRSNESGCLVAGEVNDFAALAQVRDPVIFTRFARTSSPELLPLEDGTGSVVSITLRDPT